MLGLIFLNFPRIQCIIITILIIIYYYHYHLSIEQQFAHLIGIISD